MKFQFIKSFKFVIRINGETCEVLRVSGLGLGYNIEERGCTYNPVTIELPIKKDEKGNIVTAFDIFKKYFSSDNFDVEIFPIKNINKEGIGEQEDFSFMLENCEMIRYSVSDFDAFSSDVITESIEILPGKLLFRKS